MRQVSGMGAASTTGQGVCVGSVRGLQTIRAGAAGREPGERERRVVVVRDEIAVLHVVRRMDVRPSEWTTRSAVPNASRPIDLHLHRGPGQTRDDQRPGFSHDESGHGVRYRGRDRSEDVAAIIGPGKVEPRVGIADRRLQPGEVCVLRLTRLTKRRVGRRAPVERCSPGVTGLNRSRQRNDPGRSVYASRDARVPRGRRTARVPGEDQVGLCSLASGRGARECSRRRMCRLLEIGLHDRHQRRDQRSLTGRPVRVSNRVGPERDRVREKSVSGDFI